MIDMLERAPVVVPPAKPRPKKLTLWRRVLRRSVKPLVMMFLAGGVALGLVAVPVAKAEADILSAATIAEIKGAMRMPLTQVVVGAIRAHPVGFAVVGVGSLALYAYAEKDHWFPYVTGLFGAKTESPPSVDPVTGTRTQPGWTMSGASLNATQKTLTWTGKRSLPIPMGGFNVGWAYALDCKNEATGVVTQRKSGTASNYAYNATAPADIVYQAWCRDPVTNANTNEIVVGGMLGAAGAAPELVPMCASPTWCGYAGIENVYRWGTMQPVQNEGFDPRGEGTNYVTSAECIDSAGNLTVIEYTSKGTDGMLRMPPCAEMVPGSHGTGKMWIDGYAPGSTVPQRLYDVDPMTDPDHPLCSPSRPGSGCTLGVSIDGKPCVIGDVQCENWTEIRRDDQTGARVSCNYGPYAVGVDKCNILERAYQIGGAPATEENIDGNPDTANWNQPNGDPWKPQPQPEPGTGNQTSTLPTTGTNPGATPGESGQNCLSQGWSWNPVSWVMVPTQCALQWAFVPPKTSIEAAVATLTPKLEARGIAPFVTPVMQGIEGLGGSGCQGPAINLQAIKIQETLYPFSACAQPMSQIATGVYSFFALSIVLQGGMSCIRGVAAAFGFNWGLGSSKVTDGS